MDDSDTVYLDVTDPSILDMVLYNHVPAEVWSTGGSLMAVYCEKCGHSWPCPSTLSARSRQAFLDTAAERAVRDGS